MKHIQHRRIAFQSKEGRHQKGKNLCRVYPAVDRQDCLLNHKVFEKLSSGVVAGNDIVVQNPLHQGIIADVNQTGDRLFQKRIIEAGILLDIIVQGDKSPVSDVKGNIHKLLHNVKTILLVHTAALYPLNDILCTHIHRK